MTGHRSEVWSADVVQLPSTKNINTNSDEGSGDRWRLITGAADVQLRVWSLKALLSSGEGSANDNSGQATDIASYIGSIHRQNASERIELVKINSDGTMVGILSHNSKSIEVYSFRSYTESKKKCNRRLRRRREKASLAEEKSKSKESSLKRGILNDDVETPKIEEGEENILSLLEDDLPADIIKASDELEILGILRSGHKIKGFSFAPNNRIAISTATNIVEVYSMNKLSEGEGEHGFEKLSSYEMDGHPTGIRSVALSSNDALACTISKGAAKVGKQKRIK